MSLLTILSSPAPSKKEGKEANTQETEMSLNLLNLLRGKQHYSSYFVREKTGSALQ